ncbi:MULTISPECIES: transposase [Tissierellales]|jgi:REP element-mobilizing transposase RayT|uniref:Transposase n=1 Tax=Acidilutibacter cellobiosedens TaxID=2507161 RepID=A0A410Q884_9FIRM|nr:MULTISPECIES: transposase [Tissierellales]MBE6083282.1 transposase [Tissierellaceae bacterium]QAT60183.1 transposase [Acidilutibacter cellobiosedens]SCL92514.1 Transposase [Sporanaerobacter sp. PP17-6a]
MSRKAREKSSTGIYHVILRGINGQIIFKDNEDYKKLIQTINEYKEISGYEIYAFCLMNNHIHLLMKEGKEDLGIVFRRIGASYVYWYNRKYKRRGHLFQDRYKSEPVEDDKYFLTVLRYIHQNPIKAGIETNISKYPWSSYNEYLGKENICDIKFALDFFADEKKRAVDLFKKFNSEENDDKCFEYEKDGRIDDIEAAKLIEKTAKVENPNQVQNCEKEKRDKIIKELKNGGLSIRQIERLTGISFAVIRRI